MCDFPAVLNFNRLILKLNGFYLLLTAGSLRS